MLPLWWLRFLRLGAASDPRQWGACMHQGVLRAAFAAGVVMHGLNLYWAALLLRKAHGWWRGGALRSADGLGGFADPSLTELNPFPFTPLPFGVPFVPADSLALFTRVLASFS